MKNIVEQLKSIRREHGLSQSEFGERLGLPQSHISRIEQGETDPRFFTVADMARVLDQELVLIPRSMVSYVHSILYGEGEEERRFQLDEGTGK